MAAIPRFCSNCGTPLVPGSRFCANCGAPLQAGPAQPGAPPPAPPAPPPAPQSPYAAPPVIPTPAAPPPAPQPPHAAPPAAPAPAAAEPILGIISLQQRKGFMGSSVETVCMLVTPQRLAMVQVSKEAMNQAIAAARDEARSAGKGFFGQVGAQLGWMKTLYRRYQETPIDVSLAQAPGSFVIFNQQVRSIRLKDPAIIQIGLQADDDPNKRSEMTIETTAGKQKWELMDMKAKEARQILQQTLGGVVR